MDLLTVVTHELGHILGLDHGGSFMDADLDAGERLVGELVFDELTGELVPSDGNGSKPRVDTALDLKSQDDDNVAGTLVNEDWIVEV